MEFLTILVLSLPVENVSAVSGAEKLHGRPALMSTYICFDGSDAKGKTYDITVLERSA